MDREYIATRRNEIEKKLAELVAEFRDLDAAERVLDRREGKVINTCVEPELLESLSEYNYHSHAYTALGPILKSFRSSMKGVCEKSAIKSAQRFAGERPEFSYSDFIPFRIAKSMKADNLKMCDHFIHNCFAAELAEVSLPEKKLTLPDMILEAMAMLATMGEKFVAPKRVEAMVRTMFSPEEMSQNVNSVMWRMASKGTIYRDSETSMYSLLPKMNKAADDDTLAGPSAALDSNHKRRESAIGGGT